MITVRVLVAVLSAGDVAGPAADVLAPYPEGGKVLAQAGKVVGRGGRVCVRGLGCRGGCDAAWLRAEGGVGARHVGLRRGLRLGVVGIHGSIVAILFMPVHARSVSYRDGSS